MKMLLKAVILIGGPSKGTRFRPLSLDIPKPLFPIAGLPVIQHHIQACIKLQNLNEILIIGSYPWSELSSFVQDMSKKYKINVRYLQEFVPLGTAGGIYHFRDQICSGNPTYFFVLNGDVCADFPLEKLVSFHDSKKAILTILATEATRPQSLNYGCIVTNDINQVKHYVEKPSTFVSTLINCGIYMVSPEIFLTMADIYNASQRANGTYVNGIENGKDSAFMSLEHDILMNLAGGERLFALPTSNWWSQMKTAGSAIYANRHYLALSRENDSQHIVPENKCSYKVVGDVYVHPSASVHQTAVLGPNVSIGENAIIGPGVRIRESIILSDAQIQCHSIVLYSIVGTNSIIGEWARVEGTPCDPNPNKPFAKMDNLPLFNVNGKLNPSMTVLGNNVNLASEKILLNSIVLPHKQIKRSFKNEIIL